MNRIEYEKRTVEKMIRLYCRRKEGNRVLCDECRAVLAYAVARLDSCKLGEGKPTCKACSVHCYKADMRERIRRIMRWSGPRMMLYHPLDAVKHIARNLMRH